MKKFPVAAVLALGLLFGCTFGCEVEQTLAKGLAPQIGGLLGCPAAAVPLIQADVVAFVNVGRFCAVAKHCEEQKKDLKGGVIASAICPLVAATATAYVGTAIPAKWIAAGCQPAVGGLGGVALQACNLLPF